LSLVLRAKCHAAPARTHPEQRAGHSSVSRHASLLSLP
jgi:hypothetical protein